MSLCLIDELLRQALVIGEAEKYQNESKNLDLEFKYRKQELKNVSSQKSIYLDNYFYITINKLEKENNRLN